ncbi:MAG TPA: PAS domain S-box protein [Bacillus bacterium]|uniref:methyl-accepting chemotaxis protein n=1 Tax=Siminovitchia fordii TaxID=254759 RepID=UPI000370DE47|nr:methyl-accepting chemotaxis protein [Siminovitchia fordii]HBZ10786.1 PAS domain S-box protein [Bacillus sp. (in: firmicutes)]
MKHQLSQVSPSSTQVLEEHAVLAALEQSLAMIEFDPHGKVLWANENFAQAMGYRTEELPNMHHRNFCTPDFAQGPEYHAFWSNFRNGQSFQRKVQRVTKQGRLIWLEATYTPVFNDEGKVQAVVKVATDITARENAAAKVTHDLQHMAESLKSRAEAGMTRSYEIASAMKEITEKIKANMDILQTLNVQTEAIRSIVETIGNISSQTKLLALNAAIQAAHAGDYGRGFDVIAKEVQKLANQAEKSTQKVHSNVEEITGQVHNISSGTIQLEEIISESYFRTEKAVHEFNGIDEAAQQLDRQAKTLVEQLQGDNVKRV